MPPRSNRTSHRRPAEPRTSITIGDRLIEVGQQLRLMIQSMTLEGQTIARTDGYVLFVSGAIPGETVLAEVTSVGKDYGRARVVSVESPADGRIEPRCRHAAVCGGCDWQHISYPEQLSWKQELLTSTISHALNGRRLPVQPMIGMEEPWGTRHRIRYTVAAFGFGKKRKLKLCHHKAHSVELETIRSCPVHQHDGDGIARKAFFWLSERQVPVAKPGSSKPGVLGVLVRTAGQSQQSHVVVIATADKISELDGMGEALLKLPGVAGVHLNIQPDSGSTYLGAETIHLSGDTRLVEHVGGVDFCVSPDAFFQTNALAAERLLDVVKQFVEIDRPRRLLDLYAGVGLLSLPLAKAGFDVTAVEENRRAVQDGRITQERSGIRGCRFYVDRVQNYLRKSGQQKFDTVILDPPREGCPDWATGVLGRRLRPRRIINVSCNPKALAVDLQVLTQSGYQVKAIQPIDMFPHTSHIESVTLLERGSAGRGK